MTGFSPGEVDRFAARERRCDFWSNFYPGGGFEEDLVEDMVENRWKRRAGKDAGIGEYHAQAGAMVGAEDGQTGRWREIHMGGIGTWVLNVRSARAGAGQLAVGASRWVAQHDDRQRLGTPPVGRFIVVLMVEPRKLIGGVNRHFPPTLVPSRREADVANK